MTQSFELSDGRRVVLEAYQPDHSRERLQEIVRLQRHLAHVGCFAPAVWAGPAPLARGHVVIEAYVERGCTRDGHEPVVRRALASCLHALSAALEPFVAETRLPAHLLAQLPPDRLWPTPHSKLFDFEGDVPIAAFDWDSLCKGYEPELVGFSAHAFCADWSRTGHTQAPTLEEARAFVRDYESARGAAFAAAERRLMGATFSYSVAYSARCGHAFGKREREQPGTFHELLARHGERLLDL